MSIATKYLAENNIPIAFSIEALGRELKECREIEFAYLLGSAQKGIVDALSDLDLAIYLTNPAVAKLEIYLKLCEICDRIVPGVRLDLEILNNCNDPIYKFEAIKGELLFKNDLEIWLRFYSIAAREYAPQMQHYKKQRQYRFKINHLGLDSQTSDI